MDMSYDMISMVDLARPRKRTEDSAPLRCRVARHIYGAEWLST